MTDQTDTPRTSVMTNEEQRQWEAAYLSAFGHLPKGAVMLAEKVKG